MNENNFTPSQGSSRADEFPKFDRVLVYIAVASIALSILSYFVTLITAAIVGRDVLVAAGMQNIALLAYVGLPLGFFLIFVLLFRVQRRRARSRK
ncbi:hypothetical protein KJY78_05540 [Canibacter sp. lx-45]|uniref:hypothetical protein n=1 Tax=Canibacter zhuwentaonis TaxID=2837491 RepID=UPI001BDD2EF7|nr:hypothetical protein [Canibacter zhuwentaonis]MBT1035806.1 hypothetical protein [Canibacter zhuwentaonis]